MVTVTYPWSDRGGNHNNAAIAGVFNYNNAHGGVYDNVSFRQVQDYKRKMILVESIYYSRKKKMSKNEMKNFFFFIHQFKAISPWLIITIKIECGGENHFFF